MRKNKYFLVFGTRPEAIKMAPIVRALNTEEHAECVVCVTGQHEELVNPVISLFGIRPHYRLRVMSHDQQLCGLTSILLRELSRVIALEQPDWVLVQGDTTSAMAASLAACYGKVRVAHIEAGLRSHNKAEPFPEELNRRIIDVIADLHFAPTTLDKYDLLREGFSSTSIHVTGNTSIDALRQVSALPFSIQGSALENLPLGSKQIVLVTVHRRENHGAPLEAICQAVKVLAYRYRDSVHFVVPIHPNPNVKEPVHRLLSGMKNITLAPPLGYQELVILAQASLFVLTDSGGLQEELSWLGKPSLVLRNVTDRREAVLAGASRLVGVETGAIVAAAVELMENHVLYNEMAQPRNLFGDGTASQKIVEILQAYDGANSARYSADANNAGKTLDLIKSAVAMQAASPLFDTDSTFEGPDSRML
jgi:UDP-N-acetylglucosamine 2-epimerase (non-hydrolysing)